MENESLLHGDTGIYSEVAFRKRPGLILSRSVVPFSAQIYTHCFCNLFRLKSING